MRVAYLAARGKSPLPSLGGSVIRPRPVIAVRVTGPRSTRLLDGLLDTGSDETVFEESLAGALGISLSGNEVRHVGLVGRKKPVRCRYASVELQITDGLHHTYQWSAVVGFVSTPLRYSLLGYASFLQFFDAEFRGADQEVVLTPNSSFPGIGT